MKSKKLKFAVATMAITMMVGVFAGCGNSTASTNNSSAANTETKISGTIAASGSTALQPIAEQAAANFKEKNPDATINVQGGGSGAGLTQVSQGQVQIGDSDILAEDKSADLAKGLVDHKVCAVGFAVIVNNDANVKDLSKEQIEKIFSGAVTNWKDVGGADKTIALIHRPKGSGTKVVFAKTVLGTTAEKDDLGTTEDSSGAVLTKVAQNSGSVSYVALPYLITNADAAKKVTSVKIGAVDPTNKNIIAGKYIFWSYEHMYTKGTPTGLTKAFIDYVSGPENNDLIVQQGYIKISDLKSK